MMYSVVAYNKIKNFTMNTVLIYFENNFYNKGLNQYFVIKLLLNINTYFSYNIQVGTVKHSNSSNEKHDYNKFYGILIKLEIHILWKHN